MNAIISYRMRVLANGSIALQIIDVVLWACQIANSD